MSSSGVSVLWVGGISHGDPANCSPKASMAGERFQIGLAKGLVTAGAKVEVVGVPPFPMWNGTGRFWIPSGLRDLGTGLMARTLPYPNVLGLKQLWIAIGVFFAVIKGGWSARIVTEHLNVVVYNSISYIAAPALVAAKLMGCSTVGVIADVPMPSQALEGRLRRGEARRQVRLIRKFDALVVLSNLLAQDLGRNDHPSIVIEGGVYPEDGACSPSLASAGAKMVVFAGSLNEVSGIQLALEAMKHVRDPECSLVVYGGGPLSDLVQSIAATTRNVQYLGMQPHETVIAAERAADLLISPRLPDSFVTRYTFPSKLLEYMRVGAPILANVLEGVPDEYTPYLNSPRDCTAEAWGAAIDEICLDKVGAFRAKADEGARFVLREKSWEAQGSRLYRFLVAIRARAIVVDL